MALRSVTCETTTKALAETLLRAFVFFHLYLTSKWTTTPIRGHQIINSIDITGGPE